jgi:hypothetical protein
MSSHHDGAVSRRKILEFRELVAGANGPKAGM